MKSGNQAVELILNQWQNGDLCRQVIGGGSRSGSGSHGQGAGFGRRRQGSLDGGLAVLRPHQLVAVKQALVASVHAHKGP